MGGRGRRVGRRIGPGSFVVRGRFEVVGRILICPRGGPVGGTRSGPRVRIEGGHRPAHGRGGRTARLERRPAGAGHPLRTFDPAPRVVGARGPAVPVRGRVRLAGGPRRAPRPARVGPGGRGRSVGRVPPRRLAGRSRGVAAGRCRGHGAGP